MRQKVLNGLAILTSLFGYLEWGGGNGAFLFQAELEVFGKLFSDPVSAAHPFTLVPLLGQVLLLITLFQKEPSRWLTYIGIACLALLLLMMVLVGVLGSNFKILLSTLPFLVTAVLAIREARKK
ncbi:MAG: hypothetical protein IPM25_07135 [Chloracidobacterium sp.]|nr:hypothetical protein [Chloracidobacterium sp.]